MDWTHTAEGNDQLVSVMNTVIKYKMLNKA